MPTIAELTGLRTEQLIGRHRMALDRCRRKFRYATRQEAAIVLASLLMSSKAKDRELLNIYECGFGKHFHIGRDKAGRLQGSVRDGKEKVQQC